MRILHAIDGATWRVSNPYVSQLMEALALTRRASVFHGVGRLYWGDDYDIIHFQWPEAVFAWRPPSPEQMAAFEDALQRHRRRAAIVTTVHNFKPRRGMARVFRTIYGATDCFVHLSDASLEHFLSKYPRRRHVVIPHGDYSYYGRLPAGARGVEDILPEYGDGPTVLVFGTLRELREEALAREAFQMAARGSARLVFAGALQSSIAGAAADELRQRHDAGIVRLHGTIDVEHVLPLIRTSRFLFLPRVDRLNSGVIALALTYAKPIIVPDDSTSAHLDEVGLPTYKAGDVQSAATAIERALRMPEKDYEALAKRMAAYRDAHMRWADIASEHLDVYSRLASWPQKAKRLVRATLRGRRHTPAGN
jgi:hypothetical protein